MSENIVILADRVKEISYTVGLSDFQLDDTVNGFSTFDSQYSDGDILFYAATNGIDYEIGSGIFTIGQTTNSIVRMPFRSSSANNAKVSFTDGAKEIYVTYPATHSVYIGSGVADLNFPQSSGIAFWASTNILNYDSDVIWDFDNKRLGIKKSTPNYGIDVGGSSSESSIQASGFYVGESGVVFPAANNGDVNYTGGSQVVHFEPNELDSSTLIHDVIELSGVVDNIFLFKTQPQGTFLSGPGTDACNGPCPDDYPVFRTIDISDIPDLSSLYVNLSVIEDVSGVLRSDLEATSGVLRADFLAGDTALSSDIAEASGALRSSINDTLNVFNITENNEHYEFSGFGTDAHINPNITLQRGFKYTFNVDAAGYPFYIKTSATADSNNVYNSGVTANGADVGEITFLVPQDAPDVLYYSSSATTTMSGVIHTTDVNVHSYDYIDSVDTDGADSIVLWDNSEESFKNITLDSLLFSPSGNSYLKYHTISEGDVGQTGQVAFDSSYAYFKTDDGWKRVAIQPFVIPTTTPDPNATTTTPDPNATTTTSTTTTSAPVSVFNYVLTWGDNGNGQLGYETTASSSLIPTQLDVSNITKISASDYHVLAIGLDGKLSGWGWNSDGQIGNGSKVDVSSPIVISDSMTWKDVAAGDYHSAGITTDGKLYTWGGNLHGQLGRGNRTGTLSPLRVGTASNWEKIYCGTAHTVAINSLGEMFAWGSNEYGQVGNSSFEDVLSPVKVGVGYYWHSASAYMHTLAITTEGQLLAWGRNEEGQLGITTATTTSSTDDQGNVTTTTVLSDLANINTPTPICKTSSTSITAESLTTGAGLSDNWISIAAGYKHSLAINQAGEIYSCGTNTAGAMGLPNSISQIAAFYKISNERNWTYVTAGNYHSLALNSTDDLYATGRNNAGQLGNNTTNNLFGLTKISSDYDFEQPVAGYDFSAIIGNVEITITTTTTGAPLVFTNNLTVAANGTASDAPNGVSVTGGQEGDIVEYNIPADKGSLPITCLVYASDTFLVAVTSTNGYAGETFRLTRGDQQYVFTVASGRVDI